MGMFDQRICAALLPDPEAQDLVFQTKSLDACLETFLLTKEGQLCDSAGGFSHPA